MKTVADIIALLESNLSEEGELGKHAKTLVGPRTRGSTTEFGLDLLPKHRELTKTNHPCVAKGCECYSVFAPELKGKCGALSFKRARAFGPVKVREGAHGLELYLDTKNFVKQAADEAFVYFIIGDFEGKQALFTWHPGEPLGRLEDGIADHTGVKVEQ